MARLRRGAASRGRDHFRATLTAVTHSIGEAASASLKGPSGRPAAAWVASASAAEREATTPVLPIGGGCTVAAQPAESGAHELVLYDDLGLRKRAMPISVKAPPPLARPWATLPRARKDEVRRWLRRCGRCRAFVDGSDMLQLPLPPEDDGAADAPLAWTRPAPGRVAVLRDFLPAKLAARAIRAAEAHLVEAAAHTVGVGEASGRRSGGHAPSELVDFLSSVCVTASRWGVGAGT